jgi:hypothetical protein
VKIILLFAACLLSWGMWGIALHRISRSPYFHRADYQQCITVHNGPISRPDGYTTHPYSSQGSVA